MENRFFEKPILNSPYKYSARHWELDASGQPTQQIIESRRRAEFITPIPKPRKRKGSAVQQAIIFDEGKGLSTAAQQYDPTLHVNFTTSKTSRGETDARRCHINWVILDSDWEAEFTEAYQIEADFEVRIKAEFNKLIGGRVRG